MRNDNNNKRAGARGAGRTGASFGRKPSGSGRGTAQGRPARRYSAAEGSVEGSAVESSAKRNCSKTARGAKPAAGRSFRDEKPFGKSPRGGKSFGGEKPREFESKKSFGEREFTGKRAYGMVGKSLEERKNYRGVQNYTPTQRAPKSKADEGVRLNKYIANSGICSRREADDYITAGLVSVNGVTITELGTRVYPNDVVRFNDERIKGEAKVYIVMNKPKDFVTTMSDPHAEKTVMQLVEGKCAERVYPVGRLDKATTGVLLLTNDGELADKLTHPSFEKKKIYHVFLDKNFKRTDMDTLLEGIKLEDGFIQADALSYIDEDKTQVGVEIHSGRNRIVRRMFEHFGYKVKKLDRVYFAGLTKKNLRRGQWRFLTDLEVSMLKMGSFE